MSLSAKLCLLFLALSLVSGADTPPAPKPLFVNAHVEPTDVALNQPVHVEFTTMPRQVDGIDIATVITSTLALAAHDDWRLLGRPVINEQDSKSKVIKVVMTLLPRRSGLRPIPDIPIPWLQGNYAAHVEPVRVQDKLLVAGALRDVPKEATGIADWTWGMALQDAETRVTPERVQRTADRVSITTTDDVVLEFYNGRLGQARMTVAELDLAAGRIDFLRRWGLPSEETPTQLRWIIGWTLITAAVGDNNKGTTLLFQREDVLGDVTRATIKNKVFDVLDRR